MLISLKSVLAAPFLASTVAGLATPHGLSKRDYGDPLKSFLENIIQTWVSVDTTINAVPIGNGQYTDAYTTAKAAIDELQNYISDNIFQSVWGYGPVNTTSQVNSILADWATFQPTGVHAMTALDKLIPQMNATGGTSNDLFWSSVSDLSYQSNQLEVYMGLVTFENLGGSAVLQPLKDEFHLADTISSVYGDWWTAFCAGQPASNYLCTGAN